MPAITHLDSELLDESLREVLGSQYFRSSAQCSSLLRYIVENTVADREENLREQVIGSEVFGRPPDYDTGNDHIVRSRASEVRKRLAQFYQEPGGTAVQLRIQIPSGSYRATFERVQRPLAPVEVHAAADETAPATMNLPVAASVVWDPPVSRVPAMEPAASQPLPRPKRRSWAIVALLLVVGVAALVLASGRFSRNGSTFDRFWAPLIENKKPVLIYCGGGFVYKLSDPFLDQYRSKHQIKSTRREFYATLKSGDVVDGADLIPDKHFVPFGDLAGTARIVSTLARSNKPYDLRYGDDVAFTEFRSSPVILVGGLNNSWALRVTRNLRFVLEEDDRIVDQWHKEKGWVQQADPDNLARDDYAVISRLNQSETGGFVLSIAGIRMYGTRAAADLISDPAEMNRILKDAPRGWEGKNMQIVIHTKAINDIPVSTNVEAVHFW